MVLKIIAQGGTVLLSIVWLVRDWQFHDRRTREFHAITKCLILLMLALSFLGMYSIYQDYEDMKDSTTKQSAQIMGPDVPPLIECDEVALKNGLVIFQIRNDSDYPIYNVEIVPRNINLTAAIIKTQHRPEDGMIVRPKGAAAQDTFYPKPLIVDVINPRSTHEVMRLYTPHTSLPSPGGKGGQAWVFTLSTKNGGTSFQTIEFVPVGDQWAYRNSGFVKAATNSKEMRFRSSSANYPDKRAWGIALTPI